MPSDYLIDDHEHLQRSIHLPQDRYSVLRTGSLIRQRSQCCFKSQVQFIIISTEYTGNYNDDKAPLIFWKWNEIMMNKKLVNEANKRGECELARIGK